MYMKSMKRINLYITVLLLHLYNVNATASINGINDDTKTKFKVEIKNSIGEPQTGVFLKVTGRSDVYKADSCGIILSLIHI